MPTLLDPNHITWRYYAPGGNGGPTSIWTAPNSIKDICKPLSIGDHTCTGYDFVNYVYFNPVKILQDLGADTVHYPCNLQNVSWVIPNGKWSDHPGFNDQEFDSNDIEHGPAWVASIVNALGNSTCVDPDTGNNYWKDSVIFVVWDDWGGFWDHVDPQTAPNLGVQNHCPGWGCGYTHGFRLPFLVISAYTPAGYVSGDTRTPGGGEVAPYIHDFGSVLAFIENNFSLGIGSINPGYRFADAYAPEQLATPPSIPLADFFCNAPCTAQTFRSISVPPSAWQATDFLNYTGSDTDPDNDAYDDD